MKGEASPKEVDLYFEKIPLWPELAITSDEVSGRVPSTRINSWRSLQEILDAPFFNRPKTQLIYRGHRRHDWPLTPSLGRLDPNNIISKQVADTQLKLFRRAVRGRVSDRSLVEDAEERELWSVGQHHGLWTPLLDWSYSPYVALFFAFEREDPAQGELDNPYRAIYVLNKTYVEIDGQCPDVFVFEPRKDDHGRLVNQAGLFTISEYGDTLENTLINSLHDEVLGGVEEGEEIERLAQYICKIYVPNEERVECLRHLRMMNVHHASLFPDLLGAAQFCNLVATEEVIDQRQAELAKQAKQEEETPETERGEREELGATASPEGALSLRSVLASHPDASSVEPSRLALIAEELAARLAKRQYVDWEKRDSVQAAMRNTAKAVLRRLGYPASARDDVLDHVLEAIKQDAKKCAE